MLQQFCCTFKIQMNNCPAVAIAHPSNAPATTWEQFNTQEVSNILKKKVVHECMPQEHSGADEAA
jgi:hypothetical protein